MGSDGWVCQEGVILSGLSCPFAGGSVPQLRSWSVLAKPHGFTLSYTRERRVTGSALSGGGTTVTAGRGMGQL